MRQARKIGLPQQYAEWLPCLKLCGLMPMHLSHGVPGDPLCSFMTTFHILALGVLWARAAHVDTQLFDKTSKPNRVVHYPHLQLYGPLPRPDDYHNSFLQSELNLDCKQPND